MYFAIEAIRLWLWIRFSTNTLKTWKNHTERKMWNHTKWDVALVECERVSVGGVLSKKWFQVNGLFFGELYLLKLRSDGSRLSEPLDIIAAIEKSVPFLDAAATAAAAAVALQWFEAPSSMIFQLNFIVILLLRWYLFFFTFRCTKYIFVQINLV